MNAIAALDGTVWAMTEPALEQMKRAIESLEYRDLLDASSEVENATKNRGVLQNKDKYEEDMYEVEGSTAVVPVYGKMFPRANMLTELSGGVSTRKLGKAFDEIEDREDLDRMMMVFDSPGGSVKGLTNTAKKVRDMDTKTVAFAEGLMASAAYFVGSAADEVIASPDSMVGSIGSVATIKSQAEALEEEGIEVEVVRSTPKKAKPNPAEPIDEDSVKEVQQLVNSAHKQFVRQVAINLDISEETVSNTMADGSVISGSEAEDTNFVDKVATIDDVMAEFDVSDEEEDPQQGAVNFLKNQYSDLRERHQKALSHIEDLEDEISDLQDQMQEQEIEDVIQTAIYDEKKVAPGKEDQLRAQLESNFEATTAALDLMDEGSAAPSDAPQGKTERDDDPATMEEAITALRSNGYKVANSDEAAQTFETYGQDYVRAENAVEAAREEDLL